MAAPERHDYFVDIREAIVSKQITRERACDGKSRFNRYEKAERSRLKWAAIDDKPLVIYACPFCGGFHMATALRKP